MPPEPPDRPQTARRYHRRRNRILEHFGGSGHFWCSFSVGFSPTSWRSLTLQVIYLRAQPDLSELSTTAYNHHTGTSSWDRTYRARWRSAAAKVIFCVFVNLLCFFPISSQVLWDRGNPFMDGLNWPAENMHNASLCQSCMHSGLQFHNSLKVKPTFDCCYYEPV